ncbi:N-acetyl sugar amidotransferase, partial [bacterium]|nr:N-acetyl sugar amidotransferase [bacterium]
AILRDRGDETPHEDIAKFCDFVGISAAHFFEIAERFRNLEIWHQRSDEVWTIPNFLLDTWKWQ